MPEIDKAYYLDKNSFALLLTGKGRTKVNCLDIFGEKITVSDNDACMALYGLVQEGIAKNEDELFVLDEALDRILNAVADCKTIVTAYSGGENSACMIFYICDDGMCAVVEQDRIRKQRIKLYEIESKLLPEITAELFLPNAQEDFDSFKELTAEEKDIYITSLELRSIDDDFENVLESENTYLYVDIIDSKTNLVRKKLIVTKTDSGMVSCIWKKDKVISNYYTKSDLTDFLKSSVEEK